MSWHNVYPFTNVLIVTKFNSLEFTLQVWRFINEETPLVDMALEFADQTLNFTMTYVNQTLDLTWQYVEEGKNITWFYAQKGRDVTLRTIGSIKNYAEEFDAEAIKAVVKVAAEKALRMTEEYAQWSLDNTRAYAEWTIDYSKDYARSGVEYVNGTMAGE